MRAISLSGLVSSCVFLILTLPVLTLPVLAGESGKVELTEVKSGLAISINGKPFSTYHTDPELPKPFLLPVRSPDGTVISRALNDPADKDHPHHKGIWVSIDEVNHVKFWAEQGKILNKSLKILTASGNPAKFQVVNSWQTLEGKPVATETTTISIYANHLLAYDINFAPATKEPITFRDTKEGLFGFRMTATMREKETGKVVNAEGAKGTQETWGKPSKWIDYSGTVEGKTVGLAIFDHPDNFRASRYHVRNYGLFSINPFGEKAYSRGKSEAAEDTVKPGESLRLRYAMYIHQGNAEKGKVADAYKMYLKNTKE